MGSDLKSCKNCNKNFVVSSEDFKFLQKMDVPLPTLCPDCRRRRRYAHQNMLKLYRRMCNAPGHSESIITTTSPDVPLKVYDFDFYYSDKWDPLEYNREIDLDKSFFETFNGLVYDIPHPALRRGPESINADYSLNGGKSKNIYYSSSIWDSENVMFSFQGYKMKDCVDCYYCDFVTNCYQCVLSDNCYNVRYAYFSLECFDSSFLFDCRNCTNCFGCVNLRNKKYCFFNEQLSKEEYESKMREINTGDRDVLEEVLKKFMDFVCSMPILAERITKSVNATGNNIKNSKNVIDSYLISDDAENIYYSDSITGSKDLMDVSLCGSSELCYETITSGAGSYNLKFCIYAKQCRDSEFLFNCRNCSNCFGCIGLKNKSFHIFNRPYSEEEYKKNVSLIKEKMLERGEYGEFFSELSSIYAYNSSYAGVLFREKKERVLSWGGKWQDDPDPKIGALKEISIQEIPSDIKNVTDDIISLAIKGLSGKYFRITEGELSFYRRFNLPIPSDSPYDRIEDRIKFINYMQTIDDVCDKCGTAVKTATPHKLGYLPYCKKCFQEEIL
jgi:hypothetical protein